MSRPEDETRALLRFVLKGDEYARLHRRSKRPTDAPAARGVAPKNSLASQRWHLIIHPVY